MTTEVKDEDVVDGELVLEFNVIEAVDVLLTGVFVVAVGDGGGRAATGLVLLALANGEDGGDELGGVGGGVGGGREAQRLGRNGLWARFQK